MKKPLQVSAEAWLWVMPDYVALYLGQPLIFADRYCA